MAEYYLSPIAEKDINEIVTYITEENQTAAYKFLDSLFGTLDELAENPYMGHVREDLTNQPVRFWTFKWHYLIVYRIEKELEIVRVLSGYRDIVSLFT